MRRGLVWLTKLEITERQLLELLRAAWTGAAGGVHGTQPTDAGPLVADLALKMRNDALDIREPQTAFASADELWLIGAIATAQRGRTRLKVKAPFAHQQALDACGIGLWALGIKLPFAAIGRHTSPPRPGFGVPRSRDGLEQVEGYKLPLGMHSPRVKAMSLLRSKDRVLAKEFKAIGVSHKLQGELCRIGLMRRETRGVYVRATSGPSNDG